VCVVDPELIDYADWRATAESAGIRLLLLTTATEALRLAHSTSVDLWVINSDLPGHPGNELCSLLRTQSPRGSVFVVADEYSPAKELSAWQARATLFGVKPGHIGWLQAWLEERTCATAALRDAHSTVSI
jgi:DNA-binding response OmpR family regulator